MNIENRSFWVKPWSYKEAFVIVFTLAIAAIGFELILDKPSPLIIWPVNILLLVFLVTVIITLWFIGKKIETVQWFSGIQSSIAAIVFFVGVSLIMALVPQIEKAHSMFFLYKVTSSWLYYVAVGYFLIVLGMVSIRRLFPINKKNIGFFLNHIGLWIALAAASFGAGDIQKFSMVLQEDRTVWKAYTNQGDDVPLDFAIKLKDFQMEEYPGKLAFVNPQTGEFFEQHGKQAIFEVDTINDLVFRDYSVSVKKFLMSSVVFNNTYVAHYDYGATQSCFVEIKKDNKFLMKGWIGSESVSQAQNYILLPDSVVLVLLKPEAKRFASYFTVYEKSGAVYDSLIEVNKPIMISGWKVYQTSYDEEKGKWSDISILEIVKDPWLPIVYFGFFLMMAGSLYLIWFGKNSKKSKL